jgi:carbohydrate diacid regulator
VSLEKNDVAHLPEALAEARMAVDLGTLSRAFSRFADLAEFISRRADRTALRFIPQWVHAVYSTDRENDLIRTIRAFAECSLNVKETARRLDVHTNTVYFRLNQIKKRTGVDPRTFDGALLLLMSLRLLDSHDQNGGDHQPNGTVLPDQQSFDALAFGVGKDRSSARQGR